MSIVAHGGAAGGARPASCSITSSTWLRKRPTASCSASVRVSAVAFIPAPTGVWFDVQSSQTAQNRFKWKTEIVTHHPETPHISNALPQRQPFERVRRRIQRGVPSRGLSGKPWRRGISATDPQKTRHPHTTPRTCSSALCPHHLPSGHRLHVVRSQGYGTAGRTPKSMLKRKDVACKHTSCLNGQLATRARACVSGDSHIRICWVS